MADFNSYPSPSATVAASLFDVECTEFDSQAWRKRVQIQATKIQITQ